MRFVIAGGLLALAALLQSVLGPSLPLVRGRPDLVLVVVLAWSMLRGSGEGAFVGFLGGALLDSVTYTQFGVNSALLGLLGYFTAMPPIYETYATAFPAALLNAVLLAPTFVLCRRLLRALDGWTQLRL